MDSRATILCALIAAVASAGCDEGSVDDDAVEERAFCIHGANPPAVETGVARYLTTGGCDLAMQQHTEPNGTQWGYLHVVAATAEAYAWSDSHLDVIVWSRSCGPFGGPCGSWTQNAVVVDAEEGSPIGNSVYSVQTLRGSLALPAGHNTFRVGTRAVGASPPTPVPVHYYFTAS